MFDSNHHISQKLGIISTMKHRINTLISEDDDKTIEEERMKAAMRECGYPEWALNRDTTKNKNVQQDEPRGKVVIPYVKNLSEKVSHIMKKFNVQTISKPPMKLKSYVCNMKDKVHPMDRPGAIYKARCKRHVRKYVGETDKAKKERGYEHKIVSHKDSIESHSLREEVCAPEPAAGTRRSKRNVKKIDYKKMHTGQHIHITEGQTEVSKHVATCDHEEGDLEIVALGYEQNWYRRGIREAIEIKRHRPDLNVDEGRHYLSPLYERIISPPVKTSDPHDKIPEVN